MERSPLYTGPLPSRERESWNEPLNTPNLILPCYENCGKHAAAMQLGSVCFGFYKHGGPTDLGGCAWKVAFVRFEVKVVCFDFPMCNGYGPRSEMISARRRVGRTSVDREYRQCHW